MPLGSRGLKGWMRDETKMCSVCQWSRVGGERLTCSRSQGEGGNLPFCVVASGLKVDGVGE